METVRLKTLYVFFFIELASRRIHLAGITAHPDGFWVAQQARQLIWRLDEKETPTRFLIGDNDRKYTQAFDTLFRSEGGHVISIPFRAPNAKDYDSYCTSFVPTDNISASGNWRRVDSFRP